MGPPGPWRGAAQAPAQSQVGGPELEWVLRGSPGTPVEARGSGGPRQAPLAWAWAWSATGSRRVGLLPGLCFRLG